MENAWYEIQPKNIYQVKKEQPLTQEGQQALLYLYQPIIGGDAMSLYFCLIGDAADKTAEEFTHLDLLNAMDVGLPRFFEARKRLEGIGLLRSFQKNDPEFGKMLLYELYEPLHPQIFFREQLMSFLLLSKVGEDKFQQLMRRFRPRPVDTSGYEEVTQKFTDVFLWSEKEFGRQEEQLDKVSNAFPLEKESKLQLDTKQLNWTFIMDMAERKFIDRSAFTGSLKEKLTLYHELYGYDEMKLVELMAGVVSLTDGSIDEKALEKTVIEENKVFYKKETDEQTDDQQLRRFNTLKQQGYTDKDLEMIRQSEDLAPMEYLTAIKQTKKSFVTKNEEWLVQDLVQKSPLPNSVINVLINYLLVVQNKSSLAPALANQIAADWSEKNIRSPEAAIQHVRELAKNKLQKKTKPAYSRQQTPQKREELTDWSAYAKNITSDPKRKAEIDWMMKEYFNDEEGEK